MNTTQELIEKSQIAFAHNENEEALKQIESVLGTSPDHAEALALKGVYYLKLQNFNEAIKLLEQAKIKDPNREMIHYNLAYCWNQIRNFVEAENELRKTIVINPKHFQARALLGEVLLETERVEEGILETLKAIEINPFYLKGYLILGEIYESFGRNDVAIDLYELGVSHNAQILILREELCRLYALELNFKEAIDQASEIATLRGSDVDYLRLGTYAIALGEFKTGEDAFLKAVELNPESWEAHYNLAELYMSAGLNEEAKKEYELAISNSNSSWKPLNGMGLFFMNQKDPAKAKDFFLEALELDQDHLQPAWNLALAYAQMNEALNSKKIISQILSRNGVRGDIYAQAQRLMMSLQHE